MRWTDQEIVAFDTETTGLNPWGGDRIIEFAAVKFRISSDFEIIPNSIKPIHWLFNPGIPIPREVQALTNITNDDVANKDPFEEKATEIRALLANSITVAHNYSFDQSVLAAEYKKIGLTWPMPLAEIDTVDISRRIFHDAKSHKLAEVSARLGVTLVGAHRAVNDAEACGRSFLAMAKLDHAPEDLEGLLEWADALGRPPKTGHLELDSQGQVIIIDKNEPADHHPDYLAWMGIAKMRVNDGWQDRFPESVRSWASRWLRIVAAGRFPSGGRSFGPQDWGPQSCARPRK